MVWQINTAALWIQVAIIVRVLIMQPESVQIQISVILKRRKKSRSGSRNIIRGISEKKFPIWEAFFLQSNTKTIIINCKQEQTRKEKTVW